MSFLLEFPVFTVLLFTEVFSDLNLALKIFVLLTIIAFVRQHLQGSPLFLPIIIAVSWFVLFDYWMFFGGVFVLYTLLTMGIAGILIDFFFVSAQHMPMPKGDEFEPPKGTIADPAHRLHQQQAMHAAHARRMMR